MMVLGIAALAVVVVLVAIVIAAMAAEVPISGGGGDKGAFELVPFEPGDAAALEEITGDAATMKWIGNGQLWGPDKVARFLRKAKWEQEADCASYWGVAAKPRRLVGVVGIHRVGYYAGSVTSRVFVTVFVSEKRQGCGTAALRAALSRHWLRTRQPVYADVRPSNAASMALLEKIGFRQVEKVKIKGVPHCRLRADAPRAPPPKADAALSTFLILGKQLSSDILATTFSAAGWSPVTEDAARATGAAGILALEGARSWDKSLREIRSLLKSRLDSGVLANKVVLHDRLEGTGVVPETVVVPAGRGFVPALPGSEDGCTTWIWRPEGGWGGRGVQIVQGQAAIYRTAKGFAKSNRKQRALVTRYLTNPKLLGGKKFHLRLYLVVGVVPAGLARAKAGKRVFLCPEGDIAVAKEPFRADQYHVREIHDTHVSGHDTPEGLRFPADYPGDGAAALAAAAALLRRAVRPLLPEVVPFAEAHGGYEIFGADVMVDADDRPWLIEINSRPGYALTPEGIGEARQRWVTALVADALKGALFDTAERSIAL